MTEESPSTRFSAGTVTITNTRIQVDGEVIEKETKTEKSKRTLPMTPVIVAALRKAKAAQAAERLELGNAYGPGEYVVSDEAGYPVHPDWLSRQWHRVCALAGVRHIRLHDARHTCGTLLHLQNVPIAVVSAWLGHCDAAFTMRTYVHSQPDALAEVAQSLNAVVTRLLASGRFEHADAAGQRRDLGVWRRRRDLNPRSLSRRSLSRRVHSAALPRLQDHDGSGRVRGGAFRFPDRRGRRLRR